MSKQISAVVAQVLAMAASVEHVLINDTLAKVQVAEPAGIDGTDVLFLDWFDRTGMEMSTRFNEEDIAAGRWVGDAFVAQDFEGDAHFLKFPQRVFLKPDLPVPLGDNFEKHRGELSAGLKSLSQMHDGSAVIQEVINQLSALLAGAPADLFATLFPEQHAAMLAVHEINVLSEAEGGYDWNRLSPALSGISKALGHVRE
ncbi:hypothetical protein LA345_39760 (plasmid) [Burkholderia vietnamiensis]|uniref:Uncharacterized protein n=1 Tax=Burkholderia vietnamiensis (strain G4 / LMG 22486) TaxID=269482 RepID=A4JUF5_BURVG|nr:hypothetical protein Bcep1808_7022 [Burkholderia vietnamiensis G4]MCB4349928.1 hypothetical protein [Burkholderia vietnamiensis]